MQIESAFRVCKEAFFELSTVFLNLLDSATFSSSSDELKKFISNCVMEACDSLLACNFCNSCNSGSDLLSCNVSARNALSTPSYASVARLDNSKVLVARGPV